MYDAGTAQEYIVCNEEDVEVAPEHLSAVEGAALPLVGLTGWRALVTKTGDNASRGRNILITGYVFAILSFLICSACYGMSRGSLGYALRPCACTAVAPIVHCRWPPSRALGMQILARLKLPLRHATARRKQRVALLTA